MSGPGQLNTMSVKLIQFVGDEAAHKAADLFSASHTTLGLCVTEYLSSIKDGLLYSLSSIEDGLGNDE